jgi:crotonobetainyl-CoA:carnitine CoA-transferase CaiB-like acyl-CoA transferase
MTPAAGSAFQGDAAAYFLSVNRNKRGLSVNLKTPQGQEILRRLAAGSDIIMENFRPGPDQRPVTEVGAAPAGRACWPGP